MTMTMRAGRLTALIALAATLPPGNARAEDRALLVGVGQYERFPDLHGIGRDLEIMREVARALGFEESQIRVLADAAATRDGIAAAFDNWLIDAVGPDDRALFYFSGHGYQIDDRDGDESDGKDEILVAHDAGTLEELTGVLVDDELAGWFDRLRTDEVLVFLDSCHSGSAIKAWGLDPAVSWSPFDAAKSLSRPDAGDSDENAEALADGDAPRPLSRPDAGDIGSAGYLALSAARDWEQAQATRDGSTFTVGIGRAVREAAVSGAPLTMSRIRDVAAAEIAREHPDKMFHPVLSGDMARADDELRRLRSPSAGSPWDHLAGSLAAATPQVEVDGVRPAYRGGDLMTFEVVMPTDGHLGVFTAVEGADHATVLFPNPWSGTAWFARGERVRIPDRGFDLPVEVEDPAHRSERNLLVVVVAVDDVSHGFDRDGDGEFPLRFLVSAMNSRTVTDLWAVVPYVVRH